jgi:hypothetical protein
MSNPINAMLCIERSRQMVRIGAPPRKDRLGVDDGVATRRRTPPVDVKGAVV